MSSMGQSSSMPASQSTTVSSGQLIHSGSELAGAGVTSPGVAGAPATAQPSASAASASDIFSRLMETLSPPPLIILSIRVEASGWDYDSLVREVSLVGE